ncbi:MAG: hypothetical protein KC656_22660, partial [Myxococcales bacterium]|nr:hypothetical protein [Myxococcales bacterium]
MLFVTVALAAPVYNNDEITLGFDDPPRAALEAGLKQGLAAHGLSLERPLGAVSVPELVGLFVATSSDVREGEIDLQLRDTRVSVWEDGRTLKVASAPGGPSSTAGPDMATLVERYGLGPPSTEGGRSWEPQVTFAIEQALGVLSDAERAHLAGIRWVRRPRGEARLRPPGGLHAATYVAEGLDVRIEVYDDAASPTTRFVGTLDR